jgi:hypothetical protein
MELLQQVQDQEWFFDTELLMLCQRHGLRIHEVPVDWVEDPDTRVKITSTALADLRGVVRLLIHRHPRRPVSPGRRGQRHPSRTASHQH